MRNWYSIEMKTVAEKTVPQISIFGPIGNSWDGDGVTAQTFIADLAKIDAKEITLLINSPGGSLFDGVAMYNALKMHGAEITAKVLGVAASAASLVFMAAHKREMPKNSFLMLHNASSGAWGTAAKMREVASVLETIDKSMHATYAARSGKTDEEIKKLLAQDTWLSAERAVEEGFADNVTDDMPVEAKFDVESLPEHVRSAFSNAAKKLPKPPAAQTTSATAAQSIGAAVTAAGLDDFAMHFTLKFADVTAAQPAINEAREIKALCAAVAMDGRARELITGGKSYTEARTELMNLRASDDEKIVSSTQAKRTENQPGAAQLVSADIYSKRRSKAAV